MNIRNNIARIGATALIGCGLVATSVPATFAVEGAPQVVHTYADSAQFIAPDVWVEGQGLNIGGEGFKTADGTSGSVLALKLNKGAVKIDGQDYLEIHADAAGNFSVTIPWQEELHEMCIRDRLGVAPRVAMRSAMASTNSRTVSTWGSIIS